MNGKKVLLIDEEEPILKTFSFLLSNEGYYVVTADNGGKALKKLHQQPFDIIITDFAMKNENGHTILEEIRDSFPRIPIIVLTDNLSTVVKQFSFSLGAYALIEKSCGYEILVASIRKSLKMNKWYQ